MIRFLLVLLVSLCLGQPILAQNKNPATLKSQMVSLENNDCIKDDFGRCKLFVYSINNNPEAFNYSKYTGNLGVNTKRIVEWPEVIRLVPNFDFLEFSHKPEPTRSGSTVRSPFWVNPKSALVYLKISGAETDPHARMCLDFYFESYVYGKQRLTTICSQVVQGKRKYFEYSQYSRYPETEILLFTAQSSSPLAFPINLEVPDWSFQVSIPTSLGNGNLEIVSASAGGYDKPSYTLRLAPVLLGKQKP